ncbi:MULTISPECIES: YheU family protein [unclassified Motilimonas]|uniref:YheU family protein n=1 Tax=Motilimonas TaxID=1914248 RepID=UPI001E43E3E3|nr:MULTISPECIES: YheU family protein [unclassified Motilimonas]MCE0557122.1 YheU family protein [Motilimonas sp. E26]MDO6524357.1 YheU family protein [Motilimonas sp. 1_MG-2023]
MIIPYQDISAETLEQLIEHFVLQEGTEYGEQDISLAEKVLQVRAQLESGRVVIVYSELHESVNIVPKDQVSEENSAMLS